MLKHNFKNKKLHATERYSYLVTSPLILDGDCNGENAPHDCIIVQNNKLVDRTEFILLCTERLDRLVSIETNENHCFRKKGRCLWSTDHPSTHRTEVDGRRRDVLCLSLSLSLLRPQYREAASVVEVGRDVLDAKKVRKWIPGYSLRHEGQTIRYLEAWQRLLHLYVLLNLTVSNYGYDKKGNII